jgi:DNA adenine methylase
LLLPGDTAPTLGDTSATSRRRAALRYYGGKAALAPWIVAHVPPHARYTEAYGGSAAVLLAKPRAKLETYNDLDGAVVAFFRCLRDQPDALIRAIACTPFARAEADAAELDAPGLSDLERARRLYVRSYQTIHGAPSRGRMGWRCEKTGAGGNARAWMQIDHLPAIAERLRGVQVESADALSVLTKYDHPGCLHFVDPPYVAGTRGARWGRVAYVGGGELDDAQHRQLAAVLHDLRGAVVLAGYRCALYDALYSTWQRVERPARTQSGRVATECLWLNPAAAAARGPLGSSS